MRAQEIIRTPLLFEMAFDRKIVEQKIRGREETINEHIVKVLAFEVPEETKTYWKKEILKHYRLMAGLRLKPKSTLVPLKDWESWLYKDPFEGNETVYTEALISMNADDFERNGRPTTVIAEIIKDLHTLLCAQLAKGDPGQDIILKM